jgi:hypothetical protein
VSTRLAYLLMVVLLALSDSGCIAVAVGAAGGAAGTAYVMGKVTEELSAPVAKVYEASLAGCRDFDMVILERTSEEKAARVEAEFTDGTRATMEIEELGDKRSRLTIRVGVVGQEQRARELWEATRRHLPRSAWANETPKDQPAADRPAGK